MSHFSALVIGNDPEEQLIPYQEECSKEYLVFKDHEDEYRKKYDEESTTKVVMPDGRLLDTWDDEFRVPGSFGTGSNTHEIPKHLVQKEVPYKELFKTFEAYMKDWCGEERDENLHRYGYWHNPNAKWDWKQLGGRWRGFFKLKHPNSLKRVGESGVGDNKPRFDTDQAFKHQIDFEGMVKSVAQEASERYDRVKKLFGGAIPKVGHLWKDVIADDSPFKDLDIDEKRKFYHNQKALKQFKILQKSIKNNPSISEEDKSLILWLELDEYQLLREEYAQSFGIRAYVPFAIVMNGKWFSRGAMGWWGMVSDEKDIKEWVNQTDTLLKILPEDTLFSLYDCHT